MKEQSRFQGAPEALAALETKLMALPVEDVQPLRASVPQVVGNLLRLARSYAEDRERFVRTFSREGFDPARYDDMEQRALALWQADVDYRQVLDPERGLDEVVAEATPLRKKLLRAAIYLWEEDSELGAQVDEIRQGRGYMDLADDLVALSALFDSQWEVAAPRCAVTAADLAGARRLGLELMHRLHPANRDEAVLRARDLRDRAGAYAQLGARDVRLAAAFIFRDQPERLESYPKPLARLRRRSPSREDESQDETPAEQAQPAGA